MKRYPLFCFLLLAACMAEAGEYHVSIKGDGAGDGSSSKPFRTISEAAQVAQPGDVITVREGTYRERIDPPRGGESDEKRITYQSAPGEKVVITGAEPVKGWTKVTNDTWQVTIPNTFFGGSNPYTDRIKGDWCRNPGGYHTGAVYVNGEWLMETNKKEEVLRPVGKNTCWFVAVDDANTTFWAQFPGINPNQNQVEINVRQTVFTPSRHGINYLTVRGFEMRAAATPWAPPTAAQIGIISAYWCKGWLIENNIIRYSSCSGIALGKHGDSFDNTSANSAGGYVKTIERAYAFTLPWTKENIGHHTVRNNTISHCEQAGIVGSMGCSFGTITDNEIHDIHVRRFVQGEEMGGIKFHGAIDTLIARNHIYRCNRGIWLDWMAQGTRVTSNLLHDNASASVDWPAKWEANVSGGEQDLFLEVNHGPIIVDNNICLSTYSLNNRSQGVLFAHNLFAGSFRIVPHDARMTPYLKPHSTETAQLHDNPCGDNHFYNNIFVERSDLTGFDSAKLPNSMEGNVFIRGAKPSKLEVNPLILDKVTTELLLQQKPDGWFLNIRPQEAWETRKRPQVSTDLLGKAVISGMNYLNPDGSRMAVDADYFGKARDVSNPFPGPFNPTVQAGNAVKVWPR
jgi:alpha-N-arabinofuranosidase